MHIRGWTHDQITMALDTLREQKMVYCLTREDFKRYFGGRNREVVTVFTDLDNHCNGRVDIFEVFVALTIWSGTPWDEKLSILFRLFDMMSKGSLKSDELLLMCTVLQQTLEKFVKLHRHYDKNALKEFVKKAYPPDIVQIDSEQFRHWVHGSEPMKQLRGFAEDHAARVQPDLKMGRVQLQIAFFQKHASKLVERMERIHNFLPDFAEACVSYVSSFGRKKRWDFIVQNLRQLVLKLHEESETMHTTLGELSALVHQDEISGGTTVMIEPHKRHRQEQMMLDLEVTRKRSLQDIKEITEMINHLIELTEPNDTENIPGMTSTRRDSLNVITEEENDDIMMDMSPPRVTEHRSMMKRIYDEMLLDMEDGHVFGDQRARLSFTTDPPVTNGLMLQDANASATTAIVAVKPESENRDLAAATGSPRSNDPTLIAIADFDPPGSHQTQMLKMYVGDLITVVGQDGRGWWYGRKQNGQEGWFPPSYVQVKGAHFSSSGAPR